MQPLSFEEADALDIADRQVRVRNRRLGYGIIKAFDGFVQRQGPLFQGVTDGPSRQDAIVSLRALGFEGFVQ